MSDKPQPVAAVQRFSIRAFLQRKIIRRELSEKIIPFIGILGSHHVHEERFAHYIPLIDQCVKEGHLVVLQNDDVLGTMVGKYLAKLEYNNVVIFSVEPEDGNLKLSLESELRENGWNTVVDFASKDDMELSLLAVADSLACFFFH